MGDPNNPYASGPYGGTEGNSLFIDTLTTVTQLEETTVDPETGNAEATSTTYIGTSTESVWGSPPPDTNPLPLDSANGATAGGVVAYVGQPLTRVGTTHRFMVPDSPSLRASVPESWGDGVSYRKFLRRLDTNETLDHSGWSVHVPSARVLIRQSAIIELYDSGIPLVLDYFAYGPTAAALIAAASGGSLVDLPAHGFTEGQAVRLASGFWGLALEPGDPATHIVIGVPDANKFIVATHGAHELPGVAALGPPGTDLYVSDSAAGELTAAPPVDAVAVARIGPSGDLVDVLLAGAGGGAGGGVGTGVVVSVPKYPNASISVSDTSAARLRVEVPAPGLPARYRYAPTGGSTGYVSVGAYPPPSSSSLASLGSVTLAYRTPGAGATISLSVRAAGSDAVVATVGPLASPGLTAVTLPVPAGSAVAGSRVVVDLDTVMDGEVAEAGPLTMSWIDP